MLQRPSRIAKRVVHTPREDSVGADQPKPFLGMNARRRMRQDQRLPSYAAGGARYPDAGGTMRGSPVYKMAKRVREQRLRRIGRETTNGCYGKAAD